MYGPSPWAFPARVRLVIRLAGVGLCWGCLAASVGAYVYVSMSVFHQPFHVGVRHLRYFDLRVYRGAARRLLHDPPLYSGPIMRQLGFTYPPFAAVLFVPLTLVSYRMDEHAMLILDVLALLLMLRCAVAIAARCSRRLGPALSRPLVAWSLAAVAAGAALWLEPITTALGYGQIDPVIAALVLLDLSRPDGARARGATIGLAAAIKLTPLLFLPYLFLSGRRRAALVAGGVFVASVAIGFVVAGSASAQYWGGLVFRSRRVGPAVDIGNQSLRGALGRLTGTAHPGALTLLAVVLVALIGLALAVRAARRGNEVAGYALCAVSALLASPVTWTHHWTLAVPAVLALALIAYDRRSPPLGLAALGLLAVGYAYLPERYLYLPGGRAPVALGGLGTLVEDPYTLVGLAVLATAAAVELAPRVRSLAGHRSRSRPTVLAQ